MVPAIQVDMRLSQATALTSVKTTCTNRHSVLSRVVFRLVPVVFMAMISAACVTTPSYETAGPECLEYAIAACRTAITQDGLEAGLIHYMPVWGNGTAHVVVWVRDRDGNERIYDPAFGIYRAISSKAVILHRGEGLDLGIYGRLMSPGLGSRKREIAATGS
jgi:hypothetical protein